MGLIAAVGTAVTAVASSVGVAVAATALTVGFETIAAVGAVLGVVGQVTHIKALSYAGLALGAVGGIGALASSAGLLGAGAADLGAGAGQGAAAADAASAGTIDSVTGASGLGNAAAGEEMLGLPAAGSAEAGGAGAGGIGVSDVAGVAKQGAGFIQAASSDAPPDIGHATGNDAGLTGADALNANELARVRGGLLNTTSPVATVTPNATTTAPLTPVGQQPLPGPTAGVGGNTAAPPLTGAQWGDGPVDTHGNALTSESGSSVFSGLGDLIHNNQLVSLGVLQSAGSFLSGTTNSLTPAEVKLRNAQAAANDAATAQQKQMTANLQAPKSVASSAPITGTPQTLVPPPSTGAPQVTPAGFINQAPVPSRPVTGMAA